MKKVNLFTVLFLFFYSLSLNANHIKYGQISWECLNNGKYVFYLDVYTTCGGAAISYTNQTIEIEGFQLPRNSNNTTFNTITVSPDSAKWLSKGRGLIQPTCGSDTSNGSIGCYDYIAKKYYYKSDTLELNGTPPSSGWKFRWTAVCCRNNASNIVGSSSAYTFAIMYKNKDNHGNCLETSPKFIEPMSDPFRCSGELSINLGALDNDNDSLAYHWDQLYSGSSAAPSYQSGYSFNNPLPDSNINSGNRAAYLDNRSGLVKAKVNSLGRYLIAVRVEAWRNDTLLSEVYREREVEIMNCPSLVSGNSNDAPQIDINGQRSAHLSIKVKAGDLIQLPIIVNDTNTTTTTTSLQRVKLMGESSLFAADFQDTSACNNPPCATLTTPNLSYDSTTYRYSIEDVGAVGTNFNWSPSCNHLSDSGKSKKHHFYFLAKDDHCQLPKFNHSVLEVKVEPIAYNGIQNANGTLTSLDTVDQYQWFNCNTNTIISGQTASSFNPTQNGSYAVILQNGSCVDTTDCIQYTTVGIEHNTLKENLQLFPNPTNGLVNIELTQKHQSIQVKVRNIHGQLVQEEQFVHQSNLQLQLNSKPGIYFIELENAKGERANLKVVKR